MAFPLPNRHCEDVRGPLRSGEDKAGLASFRRTGLCSGGHNGLNSIINHIGSEEFLRLKIGVGKPHENEDQIKFVLSKVKNFELVNNSCIEAAEACISIIEEGTKTAMEKYNGV